ncbi:MAG: hypothetical protein WBL20_00625 [Sphingobium sp.]|uniref:hypothetical protein n=1 Tax=Sphingobium sp. TaxID=1912891 RepID=UPI003BB0BA0A
MSYLLRVLAAAAAMARPANTTQYAVGDLVANNATAGSVAPIEFDKAARFPGAEGKITGVRLSKSNVSLTAAAFRVHLFTAAPSVGGGDNAAFAPTNGIAKGYIGSVDVTLDKALGDGAFGRASAALLFDLDKPNAKLYALIEARDTYTPASAETFLVTLELERS